MSNTTYYQKATMQLTTSQLELAIEEAYSIIDDISELYVIKELARTVVDAFRTIEESDLSLQERIDLSVRTAKHLRSRYDSTSWHFKCASRLADRAILLAGRIVKRNMTHSKAVDEINHTIANRDRQHERRMAKHRIAPGNAAELSREPRGDKQGSTPSPKSRPQRRRSKSRPQRIAESRRRAA